MAEYDISRFLQAHEQDYALALGETRSGRKQSHWMWYIFPQMAGLGHSTMSQRFGISGLDEARAFLADPVLGAHIVEISQALLKLDTNFAGDVFCWPDDQKLKSSMTLFALAAPDNTVFTAVLDKFFGGEQCRKTWQMLGIR